MADLESSISSQTLRWYWLRQMEISRAEVNRNELLDYFKTTPERRQNIVSLAVNNTYIKAVECDSGDDRFHLEVYGFRPVDDDNLLVAWWVRGWP